MRPGRELPAARRPPGDIEAPDGSWAPDVNGTRESRVRAIAIHRAEAQGLLASAQHESTKELLRVAMRDLDEAAEWLDHPVIEDRPDLLGIADHVLELAVWRLKTVREALELYGPGAVLFG